MPYRLCLILVRLFDPYWCAALLALLPYNWWQYGYLLSPYGATPVPASASFTFTTASDVTGVEFSIGISSISLDGNALPVPAPAALTFNAGGTPPGDGNGDGNGDTGGGDNGDTGMPTPGYDDLSVALTRVGEGPVNAGDEVVVDVAVAGLEGPVTGGEITLTVDPAVAAITGGAPAGGLSRLQWMLRASRLLACPRRWKAAVMAL